MEALLQIFVYLPLIGFLGSLLFSNRNEKPIVYVAITTIGLQFLGIFVFSLYWLNHASPYLSFHSFTLYQEGNIHIFLSYYFDKITAVFAVVGTLITFLVIVFSRFYIHRESGFKRFFNTVLLFYFGYNLAVFGGNFETLFIGWEFLGVTSFLLIAFYRDRYLPIKNALKTISLYRFGDICLILSLWMSHHLWHGNITFLDLEDALAVDSHIKEHNYFALFIGLMIVLAAIIKSAQFPFSSWLPRAMEGPTSSSAIFYGSLSVHLGVFLLLRTHPYWGEMPAITALVIVIGSISALIANLIARVQSTVKTQIAYASVAQIGIMLIEIALGWHILALVHFSGNAFLRTYQLLVSPSVLSYLIHEQFFSYTPKQYGKKHSFLNKISNSIYVLSLKEWNMDAFLFNILWSPFKFIGRKLRFLSSKPVLIFLSFVFILGLGVFLNEDKIPKTIDDNIHLLFSFIGMLMVLQAFAERGNALKNWLMIIYSQFFIILSIAFLNDKYEYTEIFIYLSGLSLAAILGCFCLKNLEKTEKTVDLNKFNGFLYQYPKQGFLFLLACLAFVGLPFTPTFIGIDLMFTHVDKDEYLLISFTSVTFLFIEISVLRLYARVFLGPSQKLTHPVAYRSS